MRAMAQWWAAPTRRTMFARDMHARVRRQARPCQRLPWESRARVSSRPVRRQELDGCRARSTTAVKPRSRVDASRRTFCHHLHESVQCTHWPDAGPRRLNRAPSQADLALLRQVTPAGASLGETASAVPTAGWKYLASPKGDHFRGAEGTVVHSLRLTKITANRTCDLAKSRFFLDSARGSHNHPARAYREPCPAELPLSTHPACGGCTGGAAPGHSRPTPGRYCGARPPGAGSRSPA